MDLSNATWRKARRSCENGGNCVELAAPPGLPAMVAIRDSKDPGGPALVVTRAALRAGVRAAAARR